jgi:glutathione synthase/RimK-type ligase-like ATP-grasp enzyme
VPTIILASCSWLVDGTGPRLDSDDPTLAAALRSAGADVSIRAWDDEVDWTGADGVVVRTTWDYQERLDEFVAWAEATAAATLLLPAPEVVRWNTRKSYLMELEDRGAPTVPTAWLGAGDRVDLAALAAARDWSEVVVKPVVAAGGRGLIVARDPGAEQEAFAALTAGEDVMVQPLLTRVRTDGELSVVLLDGRVSHAVRKLPAPGQWRIHVEVGGVYEQVDLPDDLRGLAEWVVAQLPVVPAIARIDLLPADDGEWQVTELELVEPALYLDWVEGAAERVAATILGRVAAQ